MAKIYCLEWTIRKVAMFSLQSFVEANMQLRAKRSNEHIESMLVYQQNFGPDRDTDPIERHLGGIP
jgi:hypothetical protein